MTAAMLPRTNLFRVRELSQITKRDGRSEKFQLGKIEKAVERCLENGLKMPESAAQHTAEQVGKAVHGILTHSNEEVSVEGVQRLIIQQLWALGYFEAAEHYTIYREERRKVRDHFDDPEIVKLIQEDAKHFPSPLQYFQFLDKYARWDEVKKRRETWRECCDRVMGFFRKQPKLQCLRDDEWQMLDDALYNLQASCAMRVVQMAGPALERENLCSFNCSYLAVDCLEAFPEALYLLMQGSGVGFSVEADYVDQLPRVKKQKKHEPRVFQIPDHTEGWCDALKMGIYAWFDGEDVQYDFSLVRPEGAILKTKGGRSSGPEPLRRLLNFTRQIILSFQGKKLTPRACHDIMCMIGKITQLGGVRRAAEISLSDLTDTEIRDAKRGNWWDTAPWLDQANNSAVYEEKPDAVAFMEEWLALAKSGSGERGIFNRQGITANRPKRRKKAKFGANPCFEIILRSKGLCNLSIAVARSGDTPESLKQKVIIATYFGTMQATLTDFHYVRDDWKKNAEEEALLGVDITGQMDCPLLRPGAAGREKLVRDLQATVLEINESLAARFGINPAAAATCVKPSGNSGAFFACRSGIHAGFSQYQIRRVRAARSNPIAKLLINEGVPHATDPLNETLLVFDFLPDPLPEGTPDRNSMTAVEQFHNWLFWKKVWAEHSVSCTIYVGDDEWLELGHEVYQNFDQISGLSFLPRDNGTYRLAPNEELTEEEYNRRKEVFPVINWAKLVRYDRPELVESSVESACAGGACELV